MTRRRWWTRLAVASTALILAASCHNESVGPGPTVSSVAVTPSSATILAGDTVQFKATPKDASGQPVAGLSVTWGSDNPTVATVSIAGVVIGVSTGTASVSATVGGKTGQAAVTVHVLQVAGVWDFTERLIMGDGTVCSDTGSYGFEQAGAAFAGTTGQVGVCYTGGPYPYGFVIATDTVTAGQILGSDVSFDRAAGPAPGDRGIYQYVTKGCQATGTVTGDPPTEISGPVSCQAVLGEGYSPVLLSGTWQATPGVPVASITLASQSALLSGTWQATPGVPVASITLAPQSATIVPDGLQFTATTRSAAGRRLFARPITWSTDAPTVVTVSDAGVVSGVGAGMAHVTATVEGKAATASVTAQAVLLPSPLAFQSDRDGYFHIFLMQTNGHVVRLTTTTANDLEPSWAPDGSKIAFASDRDGHYQLYVMNADGTGQTRLSTSSGLDLEPAWSPDGTKIAFTSTIRPTGGYSNIYVMNADGTNLTQLTTSGGQLTDAGAAWSPDGSKIAFHSDRDSFSSFEIYVMNADGTGQTRLTTNLTNGVTIDIEPTWLPDGTRIAFLRAGGINDAGLYLMNPDGTNVVRLATPSGPWPAWSPDGAKIVFTNLMDLFTMNTDGTGLSPITGNLAVDEYGRWKP